MSARALALLPALLLGAQCTRIDPVRPPAPTTAPLPAPGPKPAEPVPAPEPSEPVPAPEPTEPTSVPAPVPKPEPKPEPRPAPAPTSPAGLSALDDVPSGPPLAWTWQEPLGDAAAAPRVIRMVRHHLSHTGAEGIADRCCDEIVRRGLRPGEVCILPQAFGMGDGDVNPKPGQPVKSPALFRHWCDGLAHARAADPDLGCERLAGADAAPEWWMTTWMSHGIAESRAWMDRFIARYRARQAADPRIPDPSRFHFDSEWIVVTHFSQRGALQAFDAMRRDPRWDAEPIPGFDGRTMAALYAEAGAPAIDPAGTWYAAQNRDWAAWYTGICVTAADAAMKAAAYDPIHRAWPAAKTSNYWTSVHADGEGDPPRFMQSDPEDGPRPWFRYRTRGSADFQAPHLYWANDAWTRSGETAEIGSLRAHRIQLDTHMHSYGGPRFDIVPWIPTTGSAWKRGGSTRAVSVSFTRDLLALLKGRGVREVIVWSDQDTQRGPAAWSGFLRALGRAYAAELSAAGLRAGESRAGGAAELLVADRRTWTVRTVASVEGGCRARIAVGFRPSTLGTPDVDDWRLWLELGALPSDAAVRVRGRGAGGAWIDVAPANMANGPWHLRTARLPRAADWLDDDRAIVLEIEVRTAQPADVPLDLAQLSGE